MKASELRIGNLINIIGLVETETTADHIKFISEGDDQYDPIPLTEEWLERLGFEMWEMDMSAWWKKQNITLLPISEGFREMKYNTDIHHVHQLQNLYFALTGEELL